MPALMFNRRDRQDAVAISTPDVADGSHIAVWFSCGAASAVAAYLAVTKYGKRCRVAVCNTPVKEEDADNQRFARDVGEWLGVTIFKVTNRKYPDSSCEDVWNDKKFMSGPLGAPCTQVLKKEARQQYERQGLPPDWHVLGFTAEEAHRHRRFVTFERSNTLPLLIEAGLTKTDCAAMLRREGIRLPDAYARGYPNANCIGCVKATSPTYWNLVREKDPEVFARRAEQSRRIGTKLVEYKGKRLFLDELPADAKGRPLKQAPDCGIFCEEK